MALLALLSLAALSYLVALVCYRIYFHPISHIPGPKLAAVTYWYQSYYDVWPHWGRFLWKARDLHAQYGPIVRVGPNEVQIIDPEFYSEMYTSGGRRRDKSKIWFWMTGWSPFTVGLASFPMGVFGTLSHDRHRMRRSAIAPFFSKQRVHSLQPMIKDKAALLKNRLLDRAGTGEVFNLHGIFAALTLDVISEYALGESWNALEHPDFGAAIANALQSLVFLHPYGRAFPLLMRLLEGSATWLVSAMSNEFDYGSSVAGFFNYVKATVTKVCNRAVSDEKDSVSKTMLYGMLQDEALPPAEKTIVRLTAETNTFIGAGTDTTARTLAVAYYYILSCPEMHTRLLKELREIMPNPGSALPPLEALERLPYMTGVVQEALRLSDSVPARLPRIAPTEDLRYGEYVIPRGTTFGSSNWYMHSDPRCFPDPQTFAPDRWIGSDADRQRRYFVPFGKGTRMCAGINLAYAEIYLTLATLLSDVEMQLFETTERDITMDHEVFIAQYPKDSKGCRVQVVGKMSS